MSKIFLVELESVPTRYTFYWKTHLPKMLKEKTGKEIVVISGNDGSGIEATTGAFLNFSETNKFKSEQAIEISNSFTQGKVEDGDIFLFADAWNPVIIQTRYMIDLLGVDAKIAGIWHAGSYDPADFLGRLIDNKEWSYSFERSLYHSMDFNFFATAFHMQMFNYTLGIESYKSYLTGFPMEYMLDVCSNNPEKDLIVFPHRPSVEKNIDVFRKVAELLPQYKFVVCQDKKLTKTEYYDIMSRAKIVFSANTQETLGISMMEGLLSGARIMVPDCLSYNEMYDTAFKYDPSYRENPEALASIIKSIMDKPLDSNSIRKESMRVYKDYFTGDTMYRILSN
jgi:glycosyltransferase involved in cell wall biosynthesis